MRAPAAALGALLLLSACRREEPPPPPDRTLEKLRAEVDRANAGGAVHAGPTGADTEDPNQRLAALAAGVAEARGPEGPLVLPADGGGAQAGPVRLTVVSAETSHQLKGKSMSLTTEELFLRAVVTAQNSGKEQTHFNIERAELATEEGRWPLARDAQVLAGTRLLGFDLQPGESREVILMFEVPPSAVLAPQLELALPQPQGGNGDARLRLK